MVLPEMRSRYPVLQFALREDLTPICWLGSTVANSISH